MLTPIRPTDEAFRLEALRRLDLLDTAPEPRFDRIVRLATRIFGVETALVSLVDAERQWFKAKVGLEVCETPRDVSFCGHAILDPEGLVVEDARQDPRFADNPLVTGSPHVAFYAGMPLRSSEGLALGTLCLLDSAPRPFGPEERQTLQDLAAWAERELQTGPTELRLIQSLREAQARYQGLFDHTGDALFWVEVQPDGGFVFGDTNPTHQRLTGLPKGFLRGRRPGDVLAPEAAAAVEARYRETVAAKHPIRYEEALDLPGGLRHWNTELVPLADGEGRITLLAGIARDLTDQRRLEEEHRLLAEVVRRTDNGVVLTDAQGQATWVNEGFTRISGYTLAEVQGQKPGKILQGPDTDAATVARMARAVAHGEGFREEVLNYDKNGRPYWNAVEAQPLRDEAGRLTGFMGLQADITARKEAERLKDDFLSVVSHELRTPLTAIQGSLGLLLGGVAGAMPPAAADMLRIAHQNTDRLGRLVNDLLDLQKVEAGRMTFDLRVQDLTAAVALAFQATEPFAAARGVRLRMEPPASPLLARVDTDRLQQVVMNFLSNAIKFSPAEGTVALRLLEEEGWGWLEVEDHGPGIPEAFRARIFQKFAQAEGGTTRVQGGTGLGLSIAKTLTERMGGRVGFVSQPGLTVFRAGFPLSPEAP